MSSTTPYLKKAPLVDTVVELRFDASMPSQVVAGLLYQSLMAEGYNEFEELPIAQLPVEIKDGDINLRYSAHYRIKSNKYLVSVSQRVIAVAAICYGDHEYSGWVAYKKEILKVLEKVKDLGIASSFSRIGVRYINLFQSGDVSDKLNIAIGVPHQENLSKEKNAGFIYNYDGMQTRVNFATDANMTFGNNEVSLSGAILDIDTSIEEEVQFDSVDGFIENGHSYTEDTFLSLLKEDLLEELRGEDEQ